MRTWITLLLIRLAMKTCKAGHAYDYLDQAKYMETYFDE